MQQYDNAKHWLKFAETLIEPHRLSDAFIINYKDLKKGRFHDREIRQEDFSFVNVKRCQSGYFSVHRTLNNTIMYCVVYSIV